MTARNTNSSSQTMFTRLQQRWRAYWHGPNTRAFVGPVGIFPSVSLLPNSTRRPILNITLETPEIISLPSFDVEEFNSKVLELPGELRNLVYDILITDPDLFTPVEGGCALPVPAPWVKGMSYLPYARVSHQYPSKAKRKQMPCLRGQLWAELICRFCASAEVTIEGRFNLDEATKVVGMDVPCRVSGKMEAVQLRESHAIRSWFARTTVGFPSSQPQLSSRRGSDILAPPSIRNSLDSREIEDCDLTFWLPKTRNCSLILHLSGDLLAYSKITLNPTKQFEGANAQLVKKTGLSIPEATTRIVELMSAISTLFNHADSLQDLRVKVKMGCNFILNDGHMIFHECGMNVGLLNEWVEPLRNVKVAKAVIIECDGKGFEKVDCGWVT